MWTISYRGHWIHGYCDETTCTVQRADYTYLRGFRGFRSLRAAKAAIGREISKGA